MAIRVTSVSVRPNATVAFWKFDQATKDHLKAEFADTGKLVEKSTDLNETGLVKTVVRTFVNQAAWDEFKADSMRITAMASRDAYNAANGISLTNAVETV